MPEIMTINPDHALDVMDKAAGRHLTRESRARIVQEQLEEQDGQSVQRKNDKEGTKPQGE